ncbi:hypothetical protein MPNT_100080 [Candidatus Methylacidithermus pantelleriae]|uniref:Uncharacterized protein n=1 Tax=Candidatus Methylacidithermus pantelleriae TaxID=2744239 RepID=A0A8J2BK22_9BACT|nr:hypothetical protein MPNT_100080 [Candidatus Methylacidithermus pantelleriae]
MREGNHSGNKPLKTVAMSQGPPRILKAHWVAFQGVAFGIAWVLPYFLTNVFFEESL